MSKAATVSVTSINIRRSGDNTLDEAVEQTDFTGIVRFGAPASTLTILSFRPAKPAWRSLERQFRPYFATLRH
jgi:hypothetical protein